MPLYEVSLSRTFVIKVKAKSARDAAEVSEFFVGYKDDATEFEKEKFGFEFQKIDMASNDVLEVKKVED